MKDQKQYNQKWEQRARRNHARIVGTAQRPRLSVFRSNAHVFIQLIDDGSGVTLASVSDYGTKSKSKSKTALAATKINGAALAEKLAADFAAQAKKIGITEAVFDRGANRYHGFIKAFAESIRRQGIRI